MNPSATIELGGADRGTMTVTGPANQEAIPADIPVKISDLSGTCTPKRTQVSLTLDTTGRPGGAAGGSSGGGSTAGGGSTGGGSVAGGSGLADTGSEDHATLKALARRPAGTITLVGTALLTFLPGRRTP
ncbi:MULTISPECIES: hypothetical protein [unclassified Streptomyces]|uniref:hypothetical protein n=1 Tax=unclassified Streptomyces TaxID=2593676 RepID=UPI00093F77A4|nr:hypothetical protein [Streptomyces sp. TSRI0107]